MNIKFPLTPTGNGIARRYRAAKQFRYVAGILSGGQVCSAISTIKKDPIIAGSFGAASLSLAEMSLYFHKQTKLLKGEYTNILKRAQSIYSIK